MQTLNPFDKLKMKSRYKRGAFMNDELQGDSREYKEAARMYNHDLKEYYRQNRSQIKSEEENVPTSQTGDLSLEEINYYLRKGFDEAEKNKNSAKSFKVAQGYGGNVMRDFSTPLFVNKQNGSDKKDSDLFFKMTDNEFRENVYPLLNVCEELYQKMEKYDPEVHKGNVDWFDACRIGFNQRFSANRYDENSTEKSRLAHAGMK